MLTKTLFLFLLNIPKTDIHPKMEYDFKGHRINQT